MDVPPPDVDRACSECGVQDIHEAQVELSLIRFGVVLCRAHYVDRRRSDRMDAWVWTCGCGHETAVTHCRVCGRYRPPEPVARDRQRIWAAINAWEERGVAFNEEGGVVATDITHKPLDPFLDELRAMVFDDGEETVEQRIARDYAADLALWHRINHLADEVEGIDGNVIRGWLDTTVREALGPNA